MTRHVRRRESGTEERTYLKVGDEELKARLYRPDGEGPFPAVIDVHGGAWRGGSRTDDAPIAEHLARNGILVASIDFRRPPATPYPGPVADIAFATRWLAAQSSALEVDADAIFGLGASSGGHQVMLAALRPNDPRYRAHGVLDSEREPILRGVISCWGVLSPCERYEMAVRRNRESLVAGHHAYWPDLSAMAEADPMLILSRNEYEVLLPALVIQGTADDNMPEGMPERFAEAFALAGGEVRLELFDGEGHGFINHRPDSPASRSALGHIVDFVRAHASS